MSDSSTSSTETKQPEFRGGSPTSGCIILVAIIVIFGGLGVLYAFTFFYQKNAIEGFTQDAPAEIAVYEPTEAEATAVREKLSAIEASAKAGKEERFSLSATDLNTMMATYEMLEGFRGNTLVDAITERGVETRMTQAMRKLPLSGRQRHLNATFIFKPELLKRTISLRVRDIVSDVGTIPEQFISNYDTIGFYKIDPENPHIKDIVPNLSRIYVEGDQVIIETGTPAEDPELIDYK